ncbi:MAG: efflux transporter outer membrane subunit [Prosthecobacter sp.]|nr:efflux transporter outer membrane subunit [Prosthecobacter sp.]
MSFPPRSSATAALLTALLLPACTVGPDFQVPFLTLPGRWKERANVSDLPVPDQWWTLFKSSTLNSLVTRALANNQDLRAALARVETARSLTGAQRASLFPQIDFQSTASFDYSSRNSIGIGGFGGATRRPESDRYRTFLNLNYEVDLWGRVRRGVEGARANEAAAADRFAAQSLIIAAEVARNFFLALSLDSQEQIIRETISLREEARNLQQSRFEGGLANEMDVARARTELELAKNDLAAIERQRGAVEHALAVLCGEMPVNFSLAKNRTFPSPPHVPAGLPSSVLLRRPDIRAAEQDLRSANASIGVATASFYPSFTLIGGGGLDSIGAEDFLEWRSRAASIGPQVNIPIFQGGRLRANLRGAYSRYEESAATYQQTILTAFREVEDAILDLKAFGKQRSAVAAALASAQDTSRLARLRYDRGLASYFEVVDADRTVLTTRLTLALLDGQRLFATVQLLRSLGGGWSGNSLK